ncbi:uncharacterized protein METZ01_LOCUS275963 [marine metagenome]|uniref:Uncharacterized protein n=1 Tax=marine metagenome TaxID=408172 RepID=A0A382KFW7_9ZZZZ
MEDLTTTVQIVGTLCVCVWIAWLVNNDDGPSAR